MWHGASCGTGMAGCTSLRSFGYQYLSLSLIMTRPSTKYMSTVNYQRPCLLNIRFLPLNSGQFSLAVSSVTVNVITLFSRWRPWQAPLWAPLYLLCLPFSLLQRFPFRSPFSFLFSFPPLTAVSAFHTWQMIARVKVFSVSILHFPKGEQKKKKKETGVGDKLSAAGFTEKIVQNCLIPGQISECIQSQAKCYCAPQFGHYTLSFPFREPLPN